AFDEVGGMDERFFMYWEDADLCCRLSKTGWAAYYDPRVTVTHLTARSSARAATRSAIAFHSSAFRYFFKHGGTVPRGLSPIVATRLAPRLLIRLCAARLPVRPLKTAVRRTDTKS